jgi:hypothetical protein
VRVLPKEITVSNGTLPMRGNLAWAALPAIDEVDVLDRFNGVPTLGIMISGTSHILFWRVIGYVSEISAWVYLPLQPAEVARLRDEDDGADLLHGLIFHAPAERPASIGAAKNNRLIFEREWVVPASKSSDDILADVARFITEATMVALQHELPATRREIMQQAALAAKKATAKLEAAAS